MTDCLEIIPEELKINDNNVLDCTLLFKTLSMHNENRKFYIEIKSTHTEIASYCSNRFLLVYVLLCLARRERKRKRKRDWIWLLIWIVCK